MEREENLLEDDIVLEKINNLKDELILKKMEEEEEYKEYKYRFLIIIIFALPNLMNAILWITFSPISKTIQDAYEVDSFIVNLTSIIFMLVYVPINFPSEYILDDISLKLGIFIGTGLTLAGAWVRIAINDSFAWAIVGQTLAGMGQPFILNAPTKIALVWFKPEARILATTILSVINILGVGIGFLIPSGFVEDNIKGDSAQSQIYNLLLAEAIMATVATVPVFILFKEKPLTPPSFAAETKKWSFKKSMHRIFKNKDFLLLWFSFSCVLGNYNCLATIVDLLIKPFGFDESNSGVLGALLIIAGLIGAGLTGLYVEKTKYYKFTMILCLIGFLSSIFMNIFVLYSYKFVYPAVACFIMGFAALPLLPLSFDLACELTFPIGEALTTGLLMTGGQIVGAIEVIIFDFFLSDGDKINSVITSSIFFGVTVLGLISVIIMKEKLVRSNREHHHHSRRQSLISHRRSILSGKSFD